MPDKSLRIWQVAMLESRLQDESTTKRVEAIPAAFWHGFTVPEIVAATGFPAWRVQQVILGDATKRTTDD